MIKSQGFSEGKVKIGNDCWIGTGVIILKNTTIGDGCIIGAGIVVSGDIPPNTVLKKSKESYELLSRT